MKKLLMCLLFVVNCNAMTDGTCGTVSSSDWNSPNDIIAKLNGVCKVPHSEECPYKCKTFYAHLMIESIRQLVEDLYNDNLVDLEIMEREILSLKNERNAEMIDQILEKIKDLKE